VAPFPFPFPFPLPFPFPFPLPLPLAALTESPAAALPAATTAAEPGEDVPGAEMLPDVELLLLPEADVVPLVLDLLSLQIVSLAESCEAFRIDPGAAPP
jgi:hypothetical protein